MRADRLISILMLLQINGRMTSNSLAKKLEVSERTIHRDMEVLSSAGIPITADRGAGGGWCILGDYKTNLTGLTEKEILTLFVPQSERILSDLGLVKNPESVFLKLLSSLPGEYQKNARYMQERIYIDTAGWWETEKNAHILPVLQEAVWQERKLKFAYKRSDELSERVISPLGLVAKGSIWYLIGIADNQVKTYRISKIEDAIISDETFLRPEDFILEQYWKESSNQFIEGLPKYPAVLRVERSLLSRLKNWRYSKIMDEEQTNDNVWVEINIRFETEEEAREYLMSLGAHAEVLEPQGLRNRIIETAKGIVELYK